MRDSILNREVFWVIDPSVLGVATAAAVLVVLLAHLPESQYGVLVWFDALTLAVAVPPGVAVALDGRHG